MSGGGGNTVTPMPSVQPSPLPPMGGGMGMPPGQAAQAQIQSLLSGNAHSPMMMGQGLIGGGMPQYPTPPSGGLLGALFQHLSQIGGQ